MAKQRRKLGEILYKAGIVKKESLIKAIKAFIRNKTIMPMTMATPIPRINSGDIRCSLSIAWIVRELHDLHEFLFEILQVSAHLLLSPGRPAGAYRLHDPLMLDSGFFYPALESQHAQF